MVEDRGVKYWDEDEYFEELNNKIKKSYDVALLAKKRGIDFSLDVDIPIAKSVAERSVNLIKTIYSFLPVEEISQRIEELEEKYGKQNPTIAFIIAREIAENKFYNFDKKIDSIDAGLRIGFAYLTLGVVASPIEGYTGLTLVKEDNKEFFNVKFSGPIRSAGTTTTCVFLMLVDYLREHFEYSKYIPTEEEINRYYIECIDYNEKVSNLQYLPTEEELKFLVKNIPIQIDGEPTENIEVSEYRNLKRVPENKIRGGMCLVLCEGLAQKAQKALARLKEVKKHGIISSGFDYLGEYSLIHSKSIEGHTGDAVYIKDLVAGRPIFGYPSRGGSFRFRYGKSRNSGFSAVSISPATMGISNSFLSLGTQLKIEKPIKGAIITSCDSIDGPIVKLKNGSVRKIKTFEEGKKLYKETEEIIYLGDMLVSLGDVVDRNSILLKSAYVEEWWDLDLKNKMEILNDYIEYDKNDISLDLAIRISKKYSIPLHPEFIYFWNQIDVEDFVKLLIWIKEGNWIEEKFILPYGNISKEKYNVGKRSLELLGVPHEVVLDNVVIEKDVAKSLFINIGSNENKLEDIISKSERRKDILALINEFAEYEIKDKSGEFIGARMGRPEKARLRKTTFNSVTSTVNSLQSTVYSQQSTVNSLQSTVNSQQSTVNQTSKVYISAVKFIEENKYDKKILSSVRGMKKCDKEEDIRKGILRSLYNLGVNKDGTIRYDGTEVPLTHFKPKEINASIEKLKEIGYNIDINGNEIISEEQIIELKPHDIVLSSFNDSGSMSSIDVFSNICNFIDEELEKIYSLDRYYNVKSKKDLVGQLVVCMAPHNCAGVVGRIIGFSQMQGIMASPYMHAAIRRDCDGDEMSVMMLMDVLLNFNKEFLPKHRGGTQDAPLILNSKINPGEVDDQILEYDLADKYDLELYEKSLNKEHSSNVKNKNVKERMKKKISCFSNIGFTHDTFDINQGEVNGMYKLLNNMKEKVEKQMELAEKIRAVDKDNVAKMIIEKHFLKDIIGNLSRFFKQQFRCSSCGLKHRRVPLIGTCRRCEGNLLMTVSYASIKKYLDTAIELTKKYDVSEYTVECVNIAQKYIHDIFGSDKQIKLNEESEEIDRKYIENKENIKEHVKDKNTKSKKDAKDVDFVHLHLHTEFSFLDGSIRVKDLFKRVKELGMDSVAITEHGNMESFVNKYQEAKKVGVKLIFGMEAYVVRDISVKDKNEHRGHLVLLAKNNIGFKNLMKLSSIASCEGFYYKPRIDKNILKKYSEGLICTSACLANDIATEIVNDNLEKAKSNLDEYLEIFGKDNFYLEVQNHNILDEKKVRDVYYKWAEEYGLNLVAACDAHYLLKEDARAHEVMLCIQTNGFLDDPKHFQFNGDGYYLMNKEEMFERFSDRPDALDNTKKIADMCNVELELGETIFPEYEPPEGYSHDEYLTKLCTESLEKIYSGKSNYEKARERMEYELSVIKKMGYSTYFLIVQDFIISAKKKCQVGPGRGSGAGSIVAYLLGITQLEPLHLDLLFERFLNPERISLPDFDIDFGDRNIVINYVKEKYGEDKVALIGTYGTMSAKSVLKDVMRVFKIPFNIANKITEYVEGKTIKESLEKKSSSGRLSNTELNRFKEEYPEIFQIAMRLEGCVRHKGVHACGVVWGKEPIVNYMPVMERDGYIVSQLEGREIEDIGLLKFDFLGLETLNITKKVLDFIEKDDNWFENIPLDDDGVYEMFREGNSVGIFQLESQGMQKSLKMVGPTNFDDIIAIVALYRPGPMQYLEVYANRKKGKERVIYPHKLTEEILSSTYGIMVYQEQVMKLAQKLAGFSMSEADILRKAIGKKKLDLMKSMEEKFKKGCLSIAKMKKGDVEKLWDDIVKFADYSFNKSHAAAYALVAYRTMYLKKHYPVEFMAAVLSSSVSDTKKMRKYLKETRNMDINVLGPDINTSLVGFNIEQMGRKKIIRFGLGGIKNVGNSAIESILSNRPYNSYKEFVAKIDASKVNKRVLKNLISVGCFDNFGINRGELLSEVESKNKKHNKQTTLFGEPTKKEEDLPKKMTIKEIIESEKELVGVCVSYNLIDLYVESRSKALNNFKFTDKESVSVFGLVEEFKKIKTKNGDTMAFLKIVNKKDSCECVIFPRTFEEFYHVMNLEEEDGVVISGVYNEGEEDRNNIIVSEIHRARMI